MSYIWSAATKSTRRMRGSNGIQAELRERPGRAAEGSARTDRGKATKEGRKGCVAQGRARCGKSPAGRQASLTGRSLEGGPRIMAIPPAHARSADETALRRPAVAPHREIAETNRLRARSKSGTGCVRSAAACRRAPRWSASRPRAHFDASTRQRAATLSWLLGRVPLERARTELKLAPGFLIRSAPEPRRIVDRVGA